MLFSSFVDSKLSKQTSLVYCPHPRYGHSPSAHPAFLQHFISKPFQIAPYQVVRHLKAVSQTRDRTTATHTPSAPPTPKTRGALLHRSYLSTECPHRTSSGSNEGRSSGQARCPASSSGDRLMGLPARHSMYLYLYLKPQIEATRRNAEQTSCLKLYLELCLALCVKTMHVDLPSVRCTSQETRWLFSATSTPYNRPSTMTTSLPSRPWPLMKPQAASPHAPTELSVCINP